MLSAVYDEDFLTTAEMMMNLLPEHKQMFNAEIFPISQGLLPHPDELKLEIDGIENPSLHKIVLSEYFGPNSTTYPDFDYYEEKHPEDLSDLSGS